MRRCRQFEQPLERPALLTMTLLAWTLRKLCEKMKLANRQPRNASGFAAEHPHAITSGEGTLIADRQAF
jgi:hypothetical protein